jgi:hypothetical protein
MSKHAQLLLSHLILPGSARPALSSSPPPALHQHRPRYCTAPHPQLQAGSHQSRSTQSGPASGFCCCVACWLLCSWLGRGRWRGRWRGLSLKPRIESYCTRTREVSGLPRNLPENLPVPGFPGPGPHTAHSIAVCSAIASGEHEVAPKRCARARKSACPSPACVHACCRGLMQAACSSPVQPRSARARALASTPNHQPCRLPPPRTSCLPQPSSPASRRVAA